MSEQEDIKRLEGNPEAVWLYYMFAHFVTEDGYVVAHNNRDRETFNPVAICESRLRMTWQHIWDNTRKEYWELLPYVKEAYDGCLIRVDRSS
jgi:hypothetical protein